MGYNSRPLVTHFYCTGAIEQQSNQQLGRMEPAERAAYVGDAVTLTCHSLMTPLWRRNEEKVAYGDVEGNKLSLVKVVTDDSGTYECKGWDGANNVFFATAVVDVGSVLN